MLKFKTIINPINWYYFVIGHLRKKLLNKSELETIEYVIQRAAQCSECAKFEQCLHCNCPTTELFLSKKPCKNNMINEK